MARCAAIKPNGERCKVDAMPDSDRCWSHDERMAGERRRRASKGGRRGGRGRPQAEINLLKAEVQEVIEAVRSGELDKGIGAVVFQGYGVLLKAHAVALDVQERLEVLPRLEEIEERMNENRGRGYGA